MSEVNGIFFKLINRDLLVSKVLKESALVEAFNLKAAIEYNMKNYEAARDAMADAPPRSEEELDPVRLD